MGNKKQILFRAPEVQRDKLDKLAEETGKSKQELLHGKLIELIEDVEVDDPRAELDEVRAEKRRVQEELEELQIQMDEMRDRLDELTGREKELEEKVKKHETIGVESYEEAVSGLVGRVVDGSVKSLSNKSDEVQNVAEDWRRSPEDVIKDMWESDPRIRSGDVAYIGSISYPLDEWEREVGDDYDDGVELVAKWLDVERRRESEIIEYDGAYVGERTYPYRVADEHGVDVSELIGDAVGLMGEEIEDVIDNHDDF